MALTPKQRRFVEEYLVDLNAAGAARRAGYDPKRADAQGYDNLRKAEIAAAIADAQAARVQRIHASQDDVLETISAWAMADPRELIEYRRVCCRFCHGRDHLYQETPSERHARKQAHDTMLTKVSPKDWAKLPQFDDLGGVGYDPRKPAAEDCPECWGRGTEEVFINDTRTLSKGAAMLYGGVKVTAQGLELKMQPKDKAVEMLARHYGLVGVKDTGDPTAPRKILLVNDPDDL